MIPKTAGLAAVVLLLSACGEPSVPFALPDGCYYSEGYGPVLRVEGDQGVLLTPHTRPERHLPEVTPAPVRRVQLRPRADRGGAYVEVTPSFYLSDLDHSAVHTGPLTGRFAIEAQGRTFAIMIPMDTYGATPATLGLPCTRSAT